MGRFNTAAVAEPTITNLAGGQAYAQSSKMELLSLLLTSFLKDQAYRSGDESLAQLKKLIEANDPVFVAKAAIYARTEFGMRSVSHVIAGEIARMVKDATWTRRFFQNVVIRVDDATEILSYYMTTYGKRKIPNALKDGLALAMQKFDAYQLAKYRSEGSELTLVDLVNIVHVKPTESNAAAFAALMKGELKSQDTWETKLTQAGQNAVSEEQKLEMKSGAWKELIQSKKLGYFALLRNLRNIMTQAPEALDDALVMLTTESLIKKSLVLPFRFVTAIEEIEKVPGQDTSKVLIALNRAVDLSLSNLPQFDGKTLVALDCSGSMSGRPAQIGSLFAAVLVKACNADLLLFSDDSKYKAVNPLDTTLTIAGSIRFASGGTNFHSIFQRAAIPYDRIVILSDMQGWVGHLSPKASFDQYRQRKGVNPFVYSFDLAGYGSLQFPEKKVFCLAGFSEKTLILMQRLEQDPQAMITAVDAITL